MESLQLNLKWPRGTLPMKIELLLGDGAGETGCVTLKLTTGFEMSAEGQMHQGHQTDKTGCGQWSSFGAAKTVVVTQAAAGTVEKATHDWNGIEIERAYQSF